MNGHKNKKRSITQNLDRGDFLDIQRTFPIQWYAVGWSKEVTKRPIRKAFLGKDITLYRTEDGKIQAIHSFCTHRGAALSLGKVEGHCLVCQV